jgi:dihydrodipicolinate synthase/N-acetylneuraminate lyase
MRAQSETNTPAGCLARLNGSLVALATPFRDGRLDTAAFAMLCDRR